MARFSLDGTSHDVTKIVPLAPGQACVAGGAQDTYVVRFPEGDDLFVARELPRAPDGARIRIGGREGMLVSQTHGWEHAGSAIALSALGAFALALVDHLDDPSADERSWPKTLGVATSAAVFTAGVVSLAYGMALLDDDLHCHFHALTVSGR